MERSPFEKDIFNDKVYVKHFHYKRLGGDGQTLLEFR